MLDIHTHILPAMDDGSKDVKESLTMLRMEYDQGVTEIVATPHFYAEDEYPQEFLTRRSSVVEALKTEIEKFPEKDKLPAIRLGAEVRYFEGIGRCDEIGEFLIEGTNYLLVELPGAYWGDTIRDALMELRQRDIRPIIAHINRHRLFSDKEVLNDLKENGMMIQINSEALFGNIFTSQRKKAIDLIESGLVQFIASDCHGSTRREPNLGKAMEILKERCEPYALAGLMRKNQLE